MKKVLVAIVFFIVFFASVVYSEDLTITTYYPSPHGSYNELFANYLELGLIDSPPGIGSSCDKEGQVLYNRLVKNVYLCDGSNWKLLGGSQNFNKLTVCVPGASTYNWMTCCQIDTADGSTSCKYAAYPLTNWISGSNPFSSGTLGTYSLSCVEGSSGYNFITCCRTNAATGTGECKQSNATLTTWTDVTSPF